MPYASTYGKQVYPWQSEELPTEEQAKIPYLTNIPQAAEVAQGRGQDVYFLSDRPETEQFLATKTPGRPYKQVLRTVRDTKPAEEQLLLSEGRREFGANEGVRQWGYDPNHPPPGKEKEAQEILKMFDQSWATRHTELMAAQKPPTPKLTVWPTMGEAIKAGKEGGEPKGKVAVAKPAVGGFIYDYETPVTEVKPNNIVLIKPGTKERKTVDKGSDEYVNLTEEGWEPFKALKPLSVDEVKGLQTLDELKDLSKSLVGIGKKYAGPIMGRARLLSSKFFDDPEFITVKTKLGKLMPIIYSLSGKQINQWELKWLQEDIIPNLTAPSANFEATLRDFQRWVGSKSNSLRESYETVGYQLPKAKSGNVVHYSVGNDRYAIPKEKESSFLKKYPNAKRLE